MKRILSNILRRMGYSVVRNSSLASLNAAAAHGRCLEFLAAMPPTHVSELLKFIPHSQAQLRQDFFVLSELGLKRGGFFVEFGAASGKELSNTWLLEKHFGWKGILAEPARCWHAALSANRSCIIEKDCVWKSTGDQLEFLESAQPELGTLAGFQDVDGHAKARESSKRYQVKTVSLGDLLVRHHAPSELDYLSIDTEGSEFEILQSVDFARYPFKTITCEHNFTSAREKIHALLKSVGYVRKYEGLSEFDDWYVRV
jgi:FkbM family methyltransferase